MATSHEFQLRDPPLDGISSVKFSNTESNHLISCSWDKSVRLYDAETNQLLGDYEHDCPVLDGVLNGKGLVYSGGLDGVLLSYDFESGTRNSLLEHEDAVRSILYSNGLVYSGSWDRTMKTYDPNSGTINSYDLGDKVFSMSCTKNLVVAALAERRIVVYDDRNMSKPLYDRESALKYQTRCIACFPSGEGFAVSSIEGRVSVEYFEINEETRAKKYAFKCHRQAGDDGTDIVYPVHSLAFHPKFGTFCSGGGDGTVCVWDGYNKKRLRQFPKYPTSISSMCFNSDGTKLAIASSYAYEEGEKSHPADAIYVRNISDSEEGIEKASLSEPGASTYKASRAVLQPDICFTSQKLIKLDNGDEFKIYEYSDETSMRERKEDDLIPLFICHHGAGFTALSFALMAEHLIKLFGKKLIVLAYDARGHGQTKVSDDNNYSLEAFSDDLVRIYNHLYRDETFDVILVGHSMGGAIVCEAAKSIPNMLGVVLMDIVEGTALEALSHMKQVISGRPKSFRSIEEATEWAVRSGTVRNKQSAQISIASQLKLNETEGNSRFTWITDLKRTEPYWDGWFQGLSEKFLRVKAAKLLILAGKDRLDRDKTLTIAQIQGKFQLVVLAEVGHTLHEDDPNKVATILFEFWKRNSKMFLPPAIRKKLLPLSLPFSEDQTQTSVVENGAKAFTVASSHSMFKPTNSKHKPIESNQDNSSSQKHNRRLSLPQTTAPKSDQESNSDTSSIRKIHSFNVPQSASGTGNTTSIFSQIAEKIAETAINSVPSKTSTSGNTVNTDEAAAPSKTSNNFLANLFSRLTSKSNASSSAIIASNEEQIVTSEIQSNSNLFARKTLSVKPATGISTSSNSDQRPSMIGNTIGTAGTSAEDLAENDSIMKMDEDQDSTQEESESFDEYDDSENPEDLSADEISWVEWYCSLPGHEYFVEVDEAFIDDAFNLTGLPSVVPYFQEALDMIQDVGPDGTYTKSELQLIESSAEMLYSLIHQRFLITKQGLALLHEKYNKKEFGVCPRVFCENHAVLPIGLSDLPNRHTVRVFCPKCIDVYQPAIQNHQHIDGCAFGTTAAPFLFVSYPDLFSELNENWVRMFTNSYDANGVQQTGIFQPKIYGFKIHPSSPYGPRMQWLRRNKPPMVMELTDSEED